MKALAVCLVLFFVGVNLVIDSVDVRADSDAIWGQGMPTILKNVPSVIDLGNGCLTYSQDVYITELHTTKSVCVYGDERLRLGYFYDGNARQAVVQLPFSNEMHILYGICTVECRYSADTDLLVTTHQTSQYGRGLAIFKHASERVKKEVSPEGAVSYNFDTSSVDYEMKSDTGRYISTPSFAISDNGMWVAAELQGKGTAIVDTRTFTTRHIVSDGYQYGVGMDPVEQLAVSNDGKNIVVTGINAGFRVIDITPECGQPLMDTLSSPISNICASSDIGIGVYFPNFRLAQRPRFLGDGDQLEVIISSWAQNARRVTFGTHGSVPVHQLRLLSLGDSFSSGEGETDDGFYLPGTNGIFNTCHISKRAYSGLISRKLGISDNDARNVACSGAKMGDIVGSNASFYGQGQRLGVAGLKLTQAEVTIAKLQAIDSFQPGKALQSSFIERYNPEILTIGIGGNDAGLMGKLRTCAMPGTCEWAQSDGIQKTAGEIQRLSDTLGLFFLSIAQKAENSQIFVVGYPQIISSDGACDAVTGALFDHNEREFITSSIHYLNQVIHATTAKAGFNYVDIEDSLKGRELCSGNPGAMNGLRFGDDVAPISAIPELKIIGAETFHPTPIGHELIADTILASYPGLVNQTVMSGEVNVDVAPYWNIESAEPIPQAFATDFAFTDTSLDPAVMTIHLADNLLQSSSKVTITIQSEPLQLATMTTNEKGGVDGEITIPSSVVSGFHTLHLLGINREGKAIDIYQFVAVGSVSHAFASGDRDIGSTTETTLIDSAYALLRGSGNLLESFASGPVIVAENGKVLGATIKKVIEMPVRTASNALKDNGVWIFVIGGLIASGVVLVAWLLLRIRWAKPGT